MLFFYRISEASYQKEKLPFDKIDCLENFVQTFGQENLKIVADRVHSKSLIQNLNQYDVTFTDLGNAGSLYFTIQEAIASNDELIYFAEDDYVYSPKAQELLTDGFVAPEIDYTTLYDHPDKYCSVYNYGETSKVYRTSKSHWRETQSTCMTFIAKRSALIRDHNIWQKHTSEDHPNDHQIFTEILNSGGGKFGKLVCAIPGACHHIDLTVSISLRKIQFDPWVIELACQTLSRKLNDPIKNPSTWDHLKMLMALQHLKGTVCE